jgi:osmotically-inducible protein OsmY
MTPILQQTDHALKTAITDELEWAPNIDSDHVAVSVTEGAVLLSGEVKTYPQKADAVRAVLRVHGVTAVADEIVVKNTWSRREDVDIARDAGTALRSTVALPADAVQAEVRDRLVTLTGTVAWNYQREAAAHAVDHVPGVTGVVNEIRLAPRSSFSASDARTRITAALTRNAQTDAGRIAIAVEGSRIILTGEVSSWSEFRQAAYAAWSTPGVTHVKNELRVVS